MMVGIQSDLQELLFRKPEKEVVVCPRTVLITDGTPVEVSIDTVPLLFRAGGVQCSHCPNEASCRDRIKIGNVLILK